MSSRALAALVVLALLHGGCGQDSSSQTLDVAPGTPSPFEGLGTPPPDAPPSTPLPPEVPPPEVSPPEVPPPEVPPPPPVDAQAQQMRERADALAATLMLRYWPTMKDAGNGIYWNYAHHWDTLLDARERQGPAAFAGTVRMFYEVQDARGWSREYYDDENWMVLTLIRAYDSTGEVEYLDRAVAIFADVMSAWDETCCGTNPGGLWWRQQKDQKATAANAGAVISAARLYQRTQEDDYLRFAQKAYEYWARYMVDATTGHVYDHITSGGSINKHWVFTASRSKRASTDSPDGAMSPPSATMGSPSTFMSKWTRRATTTPSFGMPLAQTRRAELFR